MTDTTSNSPVTSTSFLLDLAEREWHTLNNQAWDNLASGKKDNELRLKMDTVKSRASSLWQSLLKEGVRMPWRIGS